MDHRSEGRVRQVLCVAVVALLTLAGVPGAAIPQAVASPASDGAARAAQERATDPADLGYLPGEIVVIYDREATEAQKDAAAQTVEGENSAPQAEFDMGTVTTVEISDDLTVQEAAALIEDDPAVQCAMPNYVATLFDDPAPATATASDDKYRREQWYLDYVKVPEAWEALANRPSAARTKVAVIDTGASLTHPDLRRIVNKPESIEVRHPDNPTSADDWWAAPLRGDGYTNGSAAINEFSSHGTTGEWRASPAQRTPSIKTSSSIWWSSTPSRCCVSSRMAPMWPMPSSRISYSPWNTLATTVARSLT